MFLCYRDYYQNQTLMCFLLVLFGILLYSESSDLVIFSDCGAYHSATLNTTFTGKAREEIVIEQS